MRLSQEKKKKVKRRDSLQEREREKRERERREREREERRQKERRKGVEKMNVKDTHDKAKASEERTLMPPPPPRLVRPLEPKQMTNPPQVVDQAGGLTKAPWALKMPGPPRNLDAAGICTTSGTSASPRFS